MDKVNDVTRAGIDWDKGGNKDWDKGGKRTSTRVGTKIWPGGTRAGTRA